jgi:hypothetical protein
MHIIQWGVEYDPAKNAANRLKHGVGFDEAATCLADPLALSVEDDAEGEERWLLVGCSERGRVLAVSYALREHVPRLISARKATAREKTSYARRV